MFILYLLVAGRVYEPFGSCFMLMAELFSAFVSIERTKKMEATVEQTGQPVCKNNGYDIEFKDVSFSYNDELVLNGISFVAKQGQITALVGPSGSGKSTVSRLAARFWDADAGQVLLGGVDVTTVEPETLFKNYAIVFQDVTLFDDSVMENIRLGRRGRQMRKCWRQPGQLSARSLFPVCLAAITAISVRMAVPFQEASGSVSLSPGRS